MGYHQLVDRGGINWLIHPAICWTRFTTNLLIAGWQTTQPPSTKTPLMQPLLTLPLFHIFTMIPLYLLLASYKFKASLHTWATISARDPAHKYPPPTHNGTTFNIYLTTANSWMLTLPGQQPLPLPIPLHSTMLLTIPLGIWFFLCSLFSLSTRLWIFLRSIISAQLFIICTFSFPLFKLFVVLISIHFYEDLFCCWSAWSTARDPCCSNILYVIHLKLPSSDLVLNCFLFHDFDVVWARVTFF